MRRIGALLLVVAVMGLTASASGLEARAKFNGTWVGETNQGLLIKFKVNGNDEVTFMKIKVEINGPGCSSVVTSTSTQLDVPVANERFTVEIGSGDFGATVKGRFTSETRARGSIVADTTGSCPGHRRTSWNADHA